MGLVYVHWTNKHLILTVVLLFHSYMGPFALYLENLIDIYFANNARIW